MKAKIIVTQVCAGRYRLRTDVDERTWCYGAPRMGSARMMAREWALYTYGRTAKIVVEEGSC